MRITTNHPASSYGLPVILDDDGQVMDYGPGLKAVRKRLGWTQVELGVRTNKSIQSVKKYESGEIPTPAEVLNVLGDELEKEARRKPEQTTNTYQRKK